nr:MAG TPA: Fibronectin type 3 domain [Caudoviricetes sp.]
MSASTINKLDIQNDSKTMFCTWTWKKKNTKEYKVVWYYTTGDGVKFIGSETTETHKQSTYSIPDNAKTISVKVKPISKKHKVKKGKKTKEVSYWTASWSSEKRYVLSQHEEPDTPSAPTVKIDKFKLTASCENLSIDSNNKPDGIEFRVVKNNSATAFAVDPARVNNRSASYSWNISAGAKYKVQCRAYRVLAKSKTVKKAPGHIAYKSVVYYNQVLYSNWSEFSSEVETIPSAPKSITSCRARSSTEIEVKWSAVSNATSYEVQYTTKQDYFNTNPDGVSTKTIESGTTAIISGLDEGGEYFFRVRAKNSQGESGWTGIKSCKVGKKPAAPTTWSSASKAMTTDKITLYWVNNSQDGSKATKSEIYIYKDGAIHSTPVVVHSYNGETEDEEEEKTHSYVLDSTILGDGAIIKWKVRTMGVVDEWSDFSVERTIDVYAPPTLELTLSNKGGSSLETVEEFPIYVKGVAGPTNQAPIGYHISIVSLMDYEYEDQVGQTQQVSIGQEVYSKYFDIGTDLVVELSASNLDLENGVEYLMTGQVTMNSGLSAESSVQFNVDWTEDFYNVDAEIIYDDETYSCIVRPYAYTLPADYDPDTATEEPEETLVDNVTLNLYRREANGEFVEIMTDIENTKNTYVTDPHPALDYARYRVVAVSKSTGSISFEDIPAYPIDETSVIIQWDEKWENIVTSEEEPDNIPEENEWSGSRVVLRYNIDVADKNSIDVSLVEYVGRKRPVSYYGTQLGESSSWKVDIPKDDEETLYALRRLAIYTGDVYVREPSGTGYWASIAVSMNINHCQLTIPVTLDITRVEGGM